MTPYNVAKLGKWSPEKLFEVDAPRLKAFAAATNDSNPAHASGHIAPPVFALVPALEMYPAELETFLGRQLGTLGSVHGEHDLQIELPVAAGMLVATKASVVGVKVNARGTVVTTKIVSRDARDGSTLNTQYAVQFLRDFDAKLSAGESAPDHVLTRDSRLQPLMELRYPVDPDQSQRYAVASGDYGAYTLSADAAREAGFTRPILHGACTMAFCGRAVIDAACNGDPQRLKRLAVRFASPLFPGQEVSTRLWRANEVAGRVTVVFEMVDAGGTVVVSNGLAEVAL
jgi:acyl dehydratase